MDPLDEVVRYVGKTRQERCQQRLQEHCNDNVRNHRTNWVKSVLKAGRKPTLIPIEDLETSEMACDAEKFYIAYFKYLGFNLVNGTEGGEGCFGRPHSLETKNKISIKKMGNAIWKGRKHSTETIQKMKQKHKGKIISQEQREKIRKTLTGRKTPKETLSKMKCKKVVQKTLTGEIIQFFYSIKEAERVTKIHQYQISSVCKGRAKHKTAGGFLWAWAD